MSKYDLNVNAQDMNTSQGIILNQIKPKSTVLECGCATGYMTKYMNENLQCDVNIIEIDPVACSHAMNYASDWHNGDLEKMDWRKHFSNRKYDYILFADVLEHLKNPYAVLKAAVELLKDDGKVIISIPNICHNDIIIRLFYNSWQYTPLGILDNTHLRFWGVDEFEDLIKYAGLSIDSMRTVTMPTQATEQRMPFKVDDELLNLLKKHRQFSGNVYQWVAVCKKG